MAGEAEKEPSQGNTTTIELKTGTNFLKKSKKYAEIYIKRNKDNAMEKIIKKSKYDEAKKLLGQNESAVKRWSDTMRLNILLILIHKHFKSKGENSRYIFNLNSSSMKDQKDLPNEFKIDKEYTEDYKSNPLHPLITGVNRLFKQKRAKTAYNIIMSDELEKVKLTKKRDKLKHAMGRITRTDLKEANGALINMLNEIEKCVEISDLPGVVKKYEKYDYREFDIVRSFISVISDTSLEDAKKIEKLNKKIKKWESDPSILKNQLYETLHTIYYEYLLGYIVVQINKVEGNDEVQEILESEPVKVDDVKTNSNEKLKKIKIYIGKLKEIFSEIKVWDMLRWLENDLRIAEEAVNNILKRKIKRLSMFKYCYNPKFDNININEQLNSKVYEKISPLFNYVKKTVDLNECGTDDATDAYIFRVFKKYEDNISAQGTNEYINEEYVNDVIDAFRKSDDVKKKYPKLSYHMTNKVQSCLNGIYKGTTNGFPEPPYKFSEETSFKYNGSEYKLFDENPNSFDKDIFKENVGLKKTSPVFCDKLIKFIETFYEKYFNWYVHTRKYIIRKYKY